MYTKDYQVVAQLQKPIDGNVQTLFKQELRNGYSEVVEPQKCHSTWQTFRSIGSIEIGHASRASMAYQTFNSQAFFSSDHSA